MIKTRQLFQSEGRWRVFP